MRREINEILTEEQILGQLMEECAELIQAAHKVIREHQGVNRPHGGGNYIVQLEEEAADVIACISQLSSVSIENIDLICDEKLERWERRLNEEGN